MRAIVDKKASIAASSNAFDLYVRPVLFPPEVASKFERVESTSGRVSDLLDFAGIDWFWHGPNGLTAVSQRTQRLRPGQTPWGTFTVRVRLLSGRDTELQKLTKAVRSKGQVLMSFVTIHSYLSSDNQLVSSGRVKTLDLAEALILEPRRWPHITNWEDGTKFVGPTWAWLQSKGRPVRVWSSQLSLAA